jgi:hypothetical protein
VGTRPLDRGTDSLLRHTLGTQCSGGGDRTRGPRVRIAGFAAHRNLAGSSVDRDVQRSLVQRDVVRLRFISAVAPSQFCSVSGVATRVSSRAPENEMSPCSMAAAICGSCGSAFATRSLSSAARGE